MKKMLLELNNLEFLELYEILCHDESSAANQLKNKLKVLFFNSSNEVQLKNDKVDKWHKWLKQQKNKINNS